MGQGPSLTAALKESTDAQHAVAIAVAAAVKALDNTEDKAQLYMKNHTCGIVQQEGISKASYSKYSDEYSLDNLYTLVDKLTKAAEDEVSKGEPAKMIGDAADVIKATLALFGASSTVTQNLQINFSYIIDKKGQKTYATYFACNSSIVHAKNEWGNKEITAVANFYLFEEVKPNKDITAETILQGHLQTLETLEKEFDDALINAKTQKELTAINFESAKIAAVKKRMEQDLAKHVSTSDHCCCCC